MSIKLSENEVIIKQYDYATVGEKKVNGELGTSKSLIITNKRIIHREASSGGGEEKVRMSEMPVGSAKYVDTYYEKCLTKKFLTLGIIMGILAVASLILPTIVLKIIGFCLFAIAAAGFIVLYILKKKYYVVCSIQTDSLITPALYCSSRSGSSLAKNFFDTLSKAEANTTIDIRVNVKKEIAKQMAEELGAVIADAANSKIFIEPDIQETKTSVSE